MSFIRTCLIACLFLALANNSSVAFSGQLEFDTPKMTDASPGAGIRVRQVAPEFVGTKVHHALYLPTDWEPGKEYPVIVEYTGNKWESGGSTGEVEGANLGYGLSGGKGFIWVSMPYIQKGRKENSVTWWGDREATVDYCKTNVPRICEQYGGDIDNVFICGFSRGSIATSYIGLADDEIAPLWKGFITHDHFDGEKTQWGYPDCDREAAIERLERIDGRPVLVCGQNASGIRDNFLKNHFTLTSFTFLDVATRNVFTIPEGKVIHSHTDLWMHKANRFRTFAREWLQDVVAKDSKLNSKTVSWSKTHDRVFLGGDVWANPMEDWTVTDGAAQCNSFGGNRNVHLLTHQLTNPDGGFEMSVRVSLLDIKKNDLGAGFKIGVRSDINEYRSNAFAGNGIPAGVVNGKLILAGQTKAFDGLAKPNDLTLRLAGNPIAGDGGKYQLVLSALDAGGKELGSISHSANRQMVLGNVAIFNNFAKGGNRRKGNAQGSRYRFNDWTVSGDAFTVDDSHQFGPILWSMYSLSDSRSDEGFVLKLSALTGPLGAKDNKDIDLMVRKDGIWKAIGTAELDTDAWTATFRIPKWNQKVDTRYKVVYYEEHKDGSETESLWEGIIKANPSGRPLRLGALTCQKDYGFPYAPVCENLLRLDPDMLYFSGDQLYEDHGGFGLIREPADRAILNYLRKYYMHGWAFRDAMKNAPTICLPDDHDVFQGNIWGEAGAAMKWKDKGASSIGGYREPARMVNAVHKTNCGHHPDYHDPSPVEQDISVYYGDMVYGGVSFAIIADRQWKSGPEKVDTASGRADHVMDKDFDTSILDKPGLVLLGERQEEFLKQWGEDWRGHSMKVLLSQTVFAGVATHHGRYDGYLKADLDSGAWPQTARNRTVNIIRKAMPLHINGDQHLTSLVQYGVDKQRDGCWSFCTPAISAGYPRWWHPERAGMEHENRPSHDLPHTGEFVDGFGNLVYVYAVGDPEVASKKNRYELAHQKGSGFGLVTIDTDAKTYLIESFKFLIDATDGKESNQFPGWPVTIHQKENGGDNVLEQGKAAAAEEKTSDTKTEASDSASTLGISTEQPAEGIRFVALEDGTFMVPYTATIPGTDIEYSMEPIPGGTFVMGSEDGDDDEQPTFKVNVEPFWMSKYECTWAEFHRYMEFDQGFKDLATVRELTEENKIDAVTAASPVYDTDHTYGDGEGPNEAAASISQYGAKQYTKWLSLSTGNHFYRLPMEYEWEYACRAGTSTRFYFGDNEDLLEEHANFEGQEDARAEVGQRKPNAWDLHDMYGNVSEWVLDQYSEEGYLQAKEEVLNGPEAYVKPTELYPRLVRGGSFLLDAEECNSFARFPSEEDWRDQDPQDPRSPWWLTTDPATGVGFRIVRQLTPATREYKESFWEADHAQTKREVYGKVELMQRGSKGLVDPKLHEDYSKAK